MEEGIVAEAEVLSQGLGVGEGLQALVVASFWLSNMYVHVCIFERILLLKKQKIKVSEIRLHTKYVSTRLFD